PKGVRMYPTSTASRSSLIVGARHSPGTSCLAIAARDHAVRDASPAALRGRDGYAAATATFLPSRGRMLTALRAGPDLGSAHDPSGHPRRMKIPPRGTGLQPLAQRDQYGRRGAEGADLLMRASPRAPAQHARHDGALMDIQPAGSFADRFHGAS